MGDQISLKIGQDEDLVLTYDFRMLAIVGV